MTDNEQHSNFIRDIIDSDLESGKTDNSVHTRFPPEPNGYLHIGHAKSICLNFGIAEDYPNGKCNLRFDDTNPVKEEEEYVESIIEDVNWLGFDYEDRLYFASDYFQKFYEYAIQLIEQNQAYVDDQTAEEIRDTRGTLTEPGVESKYRNRSIKENLNFLPFGQVIQQTYFVLQELQIDILWIFSILHGDHNLTLGKPTRKCLRILNYFYFSSYII